MLSRKEALYYDEQLHPAFAGYLFDGTITERDAVAALFHLLTKGILEPSWKNGNILKAIVGIKRTSRKPILPFNQTLIDKMFGSKDEMSAKEIGGLIKKQTIQDVIKNHLSAIAAFPVINEELQFTFGKHGKVNFSVNGNAVDTVEEANAFRKTLYKILLPVLVGVGFLFVGFHLVYKTYIPQGNYYYFSQNISIQIARNSNNDNSLLFTGIALIAVGLFSLFAFAFSKKTVSYDFKDNVIPIAKKKYDELYTFIKTHPLQKHRFINEFLAFAIAFGFDDSWHKDFELEKEINIDKSPLT